MRLILVNPNTSAGTTMAMLSIARDAATAGVLLIGRTAPFGAPLITDPAALDTAAKAVVAMAPELSGADGVILAAFGDPGRDELQATLDCPVTGIAEAGMAEAAAGRRRFAVVTTTPDLVGRIAATAARHRHHRFAGTWIAAGDPEAVMADADGLVEALAEACGRAISEGGAEAIVIGGGPLASAARALAGQLPVPLVEPVPAAVRLALARCRKQAS
ncbi:MAG: aspartate/glutamate racemase family protein [Inquilinaceae bacterium]